MLDSSWDCCPGWHSCGRSRSNDSSMETISMPAKTILLCPLLGAVCLVISCGSQPANQGVPTLQLEPTNIQKGIYSGTVTCQYQRTVSGFGVVDSGTYDFNQTYTFDNNGLPAAGATYDANDDHIDIAGVRLNVTNRTASSSSDGFVESAAVSGVFGDGGISGTITWTLLDDGPGRVDYRLDYAVTYRQNGYPNAEMESCQGLLARPQ